MSKSIKYCLKMSNFLSRLCKIITECQMMSLNVEYCLKMSQTRKCCLIMSTIVSKWQILSQNSKYFSRMSICVSKCQILPQNVKFFPKRWFFFLRMSKILQMTNLVSKCLSASRKILQNLKSYQFISNFFKIKPFLWLFFSIS